MGVCTVPCNICTQGKAVESCGTSRGLGADGNDSVVFNVVEGMFGYQPKRREGNMASSIVVCHRNLNS